MQVATLKLILHASNAGVLLNTGSHPKVNIGVLVSIPVLLNTGSNPKVDIGVLLNTGVLLNAVM